MYRHVLCVYPYRAERNRRDGHYPPVGIEIIATVLKPYTEAIDVIDLRHETGDAADRIRPETDLVCVSMNWQDESEFVLEQIRSIPARIRTIVGGRAATQDPEQLFHDCPNVDVVVRGDGEEIIEEMERGVPLEKIDGVSFRRDSRIVHTPVRHVGPVRDDIYPDRNLRKYRYTMDIERFPGPSFDTVASSRGCPYNCRFCSLAKNPWGEKRKWTGRSAESVVGEIEKLDAENVGFLDDNFTHDPDRVAGICRLLIERGVKKRYMCQARLEISKRPDVLRLMERAGFVTLMLGIESAQDKTLRSLSKGFTTAQVRKHCRVLRRTGMLLMGYFIVGCIGEDEREMRQIIPFARSLGLDVIALSVLRNDRYTGLDELVAQHPGYHYQEAGNRYVYSDRYSVRDLHGIRLSMQWKFNTPGHILHVLKMTMRKGIITRKMLRRIPGYLLGKAVKHWRKRRKARRMASGA